jgi:PiT family inorganic phosphate transporter
MVVVVVVVVTALVFDFTNGFHDTANAMATSIATGALHPKVAVLIAGVLNLVGAFLSVEVAKTISAGLVAGGPDAVRFGNVVAKVVIPAVISPVLAGLVALAATYLAYWISTRADPATVRAGFRAGQVVSASTVALAHGANDAQKTMGVITLLLITAGVLAPGSGPPFWVIASAGVAIACGTYLGGWRIIRTLGKRVSDLQTTQGFTAEATSAAVILTSTHLGIPLSTTQVCTGSIFGAAAGRRLHSVHWRMAGHMAMAWAATLPAAAVVGAAASWVATRGTAGVVVVAVGGSALAAGIWFASRRNPVSALNVNDAPVPRSSDRARAAA